ncbi:MAG: serine/threonine-protein kinase [Acidobacteria bacterium]|nr:serine/threonine-protein kinase [Acidobacteriota bacterium]
MPSEIGPYTVLRPLARGGMGALYLARDNRLERLVAIKTIPPETVADEHLRARFLREVRVASTLVHPYIATVFDVATVDDRLFLVMEYIEGRRLDEELASREIALAERLQLAAEIAEALAAVHEHGLVHRDLKPSNLMVTPQGHVKLLDFGIARVAATAGPPVPESDIATTQATAPTASEVLTIGGAIVGTLLYCSPEQLRGEEADARSDLFGLGIVLYELFTGRHPFRRTSGPATMAAIQHEPPEPVGRALQAQVPELAGLLTRLLRKDPAARPGSATQVAVALREVRDRLTAGAPGRARVRREKAGIVLLALLLAGAAVGAVALTMPPRWNRPRYEVAVAPIADRTGDRDGAVRVAMLADLVATDLESSRIVRAVGPDQLAPLLAGLQPEPPTSSVAVRLERSLKVDFIVSGTLYREQGRYLATFDLTPTAAGTQSSALRAEGNSVIEVAEQLARGLRGLLPSVSRLTAWRDDRESDLGAILSESEEARLSYEGGLLARRDGRLGEAIARFEDAIRADPQFALAQAALAETLLDAGYTQRARRAAARAAELSVPGGTAGGERAALQVQATWARVFNHSARLVEATERLARLAPDDPAALEQHAAALANAGRFDDGLREIERAVELERSDPMLQLRLASLLLAAKQPERALVALGEADRIFRLIQSEEGVALVAMQRGAVHFEQHRFDDALAAYAEATQGLEAAGRTVLAAETEVAAAEVEIQRGQPQAAGDRLHRAEATAEATGNLGLRARVLKDRAAAYYLAGDATRAEALFADSVALARQLQNDQLLLPPLYNLASVLCYAGRLDEAQPLVSETIGLARSLDRPDWAVSALILDASIRYQSGDLVGATESYQAVVRSADTSGPGNDVAWAHAGLADIYLDQGRLAAALASSRASREAFQALSLQAWEGYALVREANVLVVLGRGREAEPLLAAAERSAAADEGVEELLTRSAVVRAAIELEAGDARAARRDAERALRTPAAAAPGVGQLALVAVCEAQLARDPARAVDPCRRAAEIRGGTPSISAGARALLAEALAGARRETEARTEATAALAAAERLGLSLATARAAAVLVSLPPPLQPPDAQDLRRRGLVALGAYLDAAPEEDRESLRHTRTVARLLSVLDEHGGGALPVERKET